MSRWKILREVRDFVFVPKCYACDQILIPERKSNVIARCFCPVCMESLILSDSPKCSLCAEPFSSGTENHLCSTCLTHPPVFKGVSPVFEYGGPLTQALLRFKYAYASYMAQGLGNILWIKTLAKIDINTDLIIPIPLHTKRLRERGFNQSALLAGVLAKQGKIRLCTSTLFRGDYTESQVGKGKKERIKNMKNAFIVRDPKESLKDKRVLLVDDVVTTTATIRSAAAVLKRDGRVASVQVVCLGRAGAD